MATANTRIHRATCALSAPQGDFCNDLGRYEGEFVNNEMQGKAIYTKADGGTISGMSLPIYVLHPHVRVCMYAVFCYVFVVATVLSPSARDARDACRHIFQGTVHPW